MKTILYNPIFINPQAYYVFPQLYDIEKGDSFIEPAIYSGYLLIEDLISNTSSQVTDTREVDFTQFAGKRIRISQYTNIGAVVLGEWLLPEGEPSGPSFHQSLVDAWFMSGPSNSDKPSSITGVNGNEMQLKNFAYSSSSGFGKYVTDFNSWNKYQDVADFTITDSKIHVTNIIIAGRGFINVSSDKSSSFKVEIKGISNISLWYQYYDNEGNPVRIEIKEDGIYAIPRTISKHLDIFAMKTGSCNITITQLPSAYEGALVFDGVDDYGICTGLPIMTDYTVICRRVLENNAKNVVASKSTRVSIGAFIFEYGNNATYSFSEYTSIGLTVNLEDSVSWQTKTSYNGNTIVTGDDAADTDTLTLGIIRERDSRLLEGAIYYFALYNKSLTPEEIEIEKERLSHEWKRRLNEEDPAWYIEALVCEYNPIRQGCTNQNMNTDNVLRDLSGNEYHMDCYNFAWNAQSGIYDDGSLILDGVDDYLKVTGLPIMDDFTVMVQNYRYNFKPSILASKSYPTANDGAFMLENIDGGGRGSLRSFGNPGWVTYIQETVNVMAMTKTECYKDFDNNVNFYVTPGTGVDSDTLWIGKIRDNNSVFGKTRLYSFLMFNRSLTKEEMDWVRNNKMNK